MAHLDNLFNRKIKTIFNQHPQGFFILFFTEMWELFGRFSIGALLILYLTTTLHFGDAHAFTLYSAFIALYFVTPIIGGFLADRYLGLKNAILLGGIVMTIGNALLVIPHLQTLYIGLAVIAVGNGFFIPALATLLGKMYDNHEQKRDAGFVMYYISKNLGALLGPILCGIVAQHYGYNYAFILSALGMLLGVFIFFYGRKHLSHINDTIETSQQSTQSFAVLKILNNYLKNHSIKVCGLIILFLILGITLILMQQLTGYLLFFASMITIGIFGSLMIKGDKKTRRNLFIIILATLFAIIFSAVLGQGGTTLSLFIERIVNRQILGIQIPTSVFYALDPIFMILLGPIVVKLVNKIQKPNYEAAAMLKFAIGMLLLGLGFIIFAIASAKAQLFGHTSALYVVAAYAVFPVAELCIMPIVISLVTRLAPRGIESMIVGMYMLGLAGASYFTGIISKLGDIHFKLTNLPDLQHAASIYSHVFMVSAVILLIACASLLVLNLKLRRNT